MLQTSDNLFSLIKAIIHLHSKILINNFNKSRNDEIKKIDSKKQKYSQFLHLKNLFNTN